MDESEILTTAVPEAPEEEPTEQTTEELTEQETTMTESETTAESLLSETYTTTEQVSDLSGIDVDRLNAFTYYGIAFIMAVFFFFVCKAVYKLFNIFF